MANQALNPSLLLDTENQRLHTNTLYLYNRGGNVKAATRAVEHLRCSFGRDGGG